MLKIVLIDSKANCLYAGVSDSQSVLWQRKSFSCHFYGWKW